MKGPEIIARTMTLPTARGGKRGKRGEEPWQYHSRSDHHSKLACWALLFDLLLECDVLRRAAEAGRIAFAVNHVMVGPINKTLDLVVTLADPGRRLEGARTFASMVDELGIRLSVDEATALVALPKVRVEGAKDVSEVVIALEAKACMTEHVKSIPRLHAEILATGYLARRAAPHSITVSFTLVNASATFRSPGKSGKVTVHHQPADAQRVIEMLSRAVPAAGELGGYGYDVLGIAVIDCANDGSPVSVVSGSPAPGADSHVHYERMIRSLCSAFRRRFATTML